MNQFAAMRIAMQDAPSFAVLALALSAVALASRSRPAPRITVLRAARLIGLHTHLTGGERAQWEDALLRSTLALDALGARWYQDFLTLWTDADSDVRILRQAKAECAKLP